MHAAYVLQAGDLQSFPRIISDESGERQCINIRGKRLRDLPPGFALACLGGHKISAPAASRRLSGGGGV